MRRDVRIRNLFLFLALSCAFFVGSGPATAQEDCDSWCLDGFFDYDYLKCIPWQLVNCTHCDTTCPGDGGWEPENQHP